MMIRSSIQHLRLFTTVLGLLRRNLDQSRESKSNVPINVQITVTTSKLEETHELTLLK